MKRNFVFDDVFLWESRYGMAKEDVDVLNYIVVCISEFASRYEMHMKDAYIYLSRNKGIDFLKEFYDVEHTLSFEDVLDDLVSVCKKTEVCQQ